MVTLFDLGYFWVSWVYPVLRVNPILQVDQKSRNSRLPDTRLGPDCMEGPHPQIDDYLAGQLTRIYCTILFSKVVLCKAGTG